jgi:hypothetical protein
MTAKVLLFFFGLVLCSAAQAQEYGFLAGVHQTTAAFDGASGGASIDGKFNFKFGLTMGFELAPGMRFRTGAIYNQRHFEMKNVTAGPLVFDEKVNFDYVDVPANFQYNFNENIGVFGGLVVGININDKVNVPGSNVNVDANANGLIPLVDVGVNILAADMIGFDVYYERGLGKIADGVKDYSTFGGNFIYWF